MAGGSAGNPMKQLAAHGLLYPLSSPLTLDRRTYCNRTATGPIHAGTHWTKQHPQITQKRLNKRNSRTHQDGLERG